MKRFLIAALTLLPLVGINPASATNNQMIECFDGGLCVDFNSFEFVTSKVGGAPKYEVSRFKGTRTFSNGKSEAIMEIDCEKEQFRTVKIKEGKRWYNFDPRWSPESDHSLLSMACSDRD